MIQYFNAPDGTRLAYRDEGTGLPVLCLAGLTRNGHDFDYLAPHLRDVRLIRLDYRGRGASDWADPETYTIPIEGQDALALLDHLGLAQAAIIGTSRGGLIGMMLAAVAKDRLLGLCLNDIGPVIEPEGLATIKTYIGKNPSVASIDALAELRARMLPGFEGVPLERWRDVARKNYRETEAGLVNCYDPDLAIVFNRPAPEGDAWPLFDALADLPVALIRGANSDILSEKTAEMMLKRRPDLHYSNVSNRGHVPFLDEPEALEVIQAWLGEMR
jgi:pimeloyl-ACP methyl ester carboxylesterase